ncbi:HesA/MoeB/ThiF family protein [Mongoliitalea daihaiensis]|uniref:HesA/MoeB/ThiF family protein n=1 Tax=Mongoliitalea daihaiensis TaxID=2782006 RepID=UPI001F3CF8F7|nr:HesA/MoeB/ThiF family protein [Mongoliitalea daihaiensis]UJP63594.1 HesA/MoeB/ThiF family protein [Mongoliitalea daihaiensis]
MDRFERQYILPGFGPASQQKLRDASVLVVGAGGLGCPALLYLSAAGIGKIGIVDGDVVSYSNLNRQVLFGQKHKGLNKAETAARVIQEKYDDITLEAYAFFLNKENILKLISTYDLIVDGSDNFPTRYLVNDTCLIAGKPLVFGAIYQNEGQVAIFNAHGTSSINYRDLYPTPPSAFEVPNCNETGVLGVLPGVIGTMMATEAIKFLSGFGETLEDKMLFYNLSNHASYQIQLSKNPDSENLRPKSSHELLQMNYENFCGLDIQTDWESVIEITKRDHPSILVDVREYGEQPEFDELNYVQIPLDELERTSHPLEPYQQIFLFCQSGIRSLKAVNMLKKHYPDKIIQSIRGGIESYFQN